MLLRSLRLKNYYKLVRNLLYSLPMITDVSLLKLVLIIDIDS